MPHAMEARTARPVVTAPRVYFCNFVFWIALSPTSHSICGWLTENLPKLSIPPYTRSTLGCVRWVTRDPPAHIPFNTMGKRCARPTVNEASVRHARYRNNLSIVTESILNCDCEASHLCVLRRDTDVRHHEYRQHLSRLFQMRIDHGYLPC
jgi:hypothetical protein